MKKLLIFMLVLCLASASQAAIVGLSIGGSSQYVATAGDVVTVNLISDAACSGANINTMVEGSASIASTQVDWGGVVTDQGSGNPITPGAGFTQASGSYLDNYQGGLFSTTSGTAVPAIAAGNVILSFEYTIDSAWDGTPYWVAPLVSGATYTYSSSGSMTAATSYANLDVAGTPTNIDITGVRIVPEPMTIALLGLGSLFLLKRRK